MTTIPGNYVEPGGAIGPHCMLIAVDGCDAESGLPMTWAMEAQSKDILAPIVRCGIWSFYADSEADCRRALGEPQ